jgi:hypothetical protein
MDHTDDDDPASRDPEDGAIGRVHEMPILDVALGYLGNDRTSSGPLLEARDVLLGLVEPRAGGRGIIVCDTSIDCREVTFRRPGNVNAISSRHAGGP